jgi:hypothetical protein
VKRSFVRKIKEEKDFFVRLCSLNNEKTATLVGGGFDLPFGERLVGWKPVFIFPGRDGRKALLYCQNFLEGETFFSTDAQADALAFECATEDKTAADDAIGERAFERILISIAVLKGIANPVSQVVTSAKRVPIIAMRGAEALDVLADFLGEPLRVQLILHRIVGFDDLILITLHQSRVELHRFHVSHLIFKNSQRYASEYRNTIIANFCLKVNVIGCFHIIGVATLLARGIASAMLNTAAK